MKIILINEDKNLYSSTRIFEESKRAGIKISHINPFDYSIDSITPPEDLSKTLVLHRVSGISFDDYDLLVSEELENSKALIANPTKVFRTLRDKERQALFLKRADLNFVPTLLLRGRPTISSLKSLAAYDCFILKTIRGCGGIGVNLINGLDSLLSILETFHAMKDQRFIIQPMVEATNEYRVLVIKGEIIGAIEKEIDSDHFRRNSIRSNGLYIPPSKIPNDVSLLAMSAFNKSKALYSGIDIIQDRDNSYILEINLVPGFKQFEELSKINVAEKLIHIRPN